MNNPSTEQIEKAVRFWTDCLGKTRNYILSQAERQNPDKSIIARWEVTSTLAGQPFAAEELARLKPLFAENLARLLSKEEFNRSGVICFGVDYHPDYPLNEALTQSGIDPRTLDILPLKTTMWIHLGGEISVRFGCYADGHEYTL